MKCKYITNQLREIGKTSSALAKKIDEQWGFLSERDVQELCEIDRGWQVLVRCGNGRFITAAQNVVWFAQMVEKGGDYVRDFSLVVDDWKHFTKKK